MRQWKALRRWGWPGFVGLACISASLAMALWWLPAQQREADSLRQAADLAQRRAIQRSAPQRAGVMQRSGPESFRDEFPAAAQRQQRVAALLSAATEHGLETRRVEFRLSHERALALARYSVATPVAGSYAALRAFIEDALARDPALSLDRLQLRRASAAAASVEADLSWSLYMRDDVPPAPLRLAASREAQR